MWTTVTVNWHLTMGPWTGTWLWVWGIKSINDHYIVNLYDTSTCRATINYNQPKMLLTMWTKNVANVLVETKAYMSKIIKDTWETRNNYFATSALFMISLATSFACWARFASKNISWSVWTWVYLSAIYKTKNKIKLDHSKVSAQVNFWAKYKCFFLKL